ncbi:hypothetical protein [Oceanicola sp. 22II-s10i]|uniref:hypothetical protein n=1 Tax=Oceanicola sp. 22II-s10i TaxID=1317116 RepID=UPI0011322C0A|nr:hypothetical protein [Oceanicola sp. 22II-s10i]
MNYGAAFNELGYCLVNNRRDWSAASDSGVCLALFTQLKGVENKRPYIDYWEAFPSLDDAEYWIGQSGNSLRKQHIMEAIQRFERRIDVVLCDGDPQKGFGNAEPWQVERRKGFWAITRFDPSTGYFRAEVFAPGESVQNKVKEA